MVRRANHLRLGRRDVRPERRDRVRGRQSGRPVREHHSRGGGRAVIQASARWLSAEEAMGQVRAGDLDPQAVVQAHLDAIDRFEERIHAYIHVDRAARSSSGVTLAVKDSLPVAGMPYTYGTTSWRDRIADGDAVPVARARAAGMAILGKTNLPELAASIGTSNTIFPPTQNPWRDGITPGGSSGGSAAAVAAGLTTVALGGDTGGSLRSPASGCGLVGLPPTPARSPSEGVDATVTQSRGPQAAEGRGLTAMDYFHAFESATNAANRAVSVPLQTRYDFLLTPTLGLLPMPIEKVPPFLGDEWAQYVQFVLPVSFARVPAISIPA